VALIRSALSSLGEAIGLGDQLVSDLKTAISEACNNVVLHAYVDDEPGSMAVTLDCSADRIDVLVRDHGGGFRRLAAAEDRMGLGLAVMSALADRVEFRSPRDGGTEVRMCFNRTQRELDSFYLGAFSDHDDMPLHLAGDAVLWLEPITLLRPVLGRVLRAIAAGAHFSVERFGDLYAVVDALADYAAHASSGSMIGFAMTGSSRRLELISGPLIDGGRMPAAQDGGFEHNGAATSGAPLQAMREALAGVVDELSAGTTESHRTLELVLLDHR
jgi:anti-sigma regulatory factor (Ser/Thr protein kinase)